MSADPARRCVAIFDLDHTLTCCDSYLLYLLGFLLRHPGRWVRTVPLPAAVLAFAVKRLDNTALKQRFLDAILGGASRGDIEAWTAAFVQRLLSRGLRRDAVQAVERHRRHGDILVLLTASLDLYVDELGRRLGFDHVVCTKAEWRDGVLSGRLAGANQRGVEKVRALQALRTTYPDAMIVAYADHRSDLPLLRQADRGILINGRWATRRHALREGLVCETWKR